MGVFAFLETGFVLDTFLFLAVAEMFWVFGGCHSLALVYLKGGFSQEGGRGWVCFCLFLN